jgi:hypothetical protein
MRDAVDPGLACYQSITNAAMEVSRIRSGGMLGDMALLRGDYSGGYEITLNSYPSIPIVQSLGLEAEPVGEDQVKLRPVLPFWMRVDLKYLIGENLAWRAWEGKKALWQNEEKIQLLQENKLAAQPFYMQQAGAGFQVAEGPFKLPDTTMEVLPLMACHDTLKEFLRGGKTDQELDKEQQLGSTEPLEPLPPDWVPHSLMSQLPDDLCYFEPWGSHVYMVIAHLEHMASERNNFGQLTDDLVWFAVPVQLCRGEGPDREVLSVGFNVPFAYSNSAVAATTGRELSGYTTVRAGVDACANTWLNDLGPLSDCVPLVEVKAEMPRALSGGGFEWSKLLEVIEGNAIAWNDEPAWNTAASFADCARTHAEQMDTLQNENEKAFADLLGMAVGLFNGQPLNQYSFKQFRDAGDPNNACYQALVRSRFVVDRVIDQQELEKRIHVNIMRRPTQPIVQTLGLVTKSTHESDEGTFDSLQPVRPFYLKADLRTLAGENITRRVHTHDWETPRDLPERNTTKSLTGRDTAAALKKEPNEQWLKSNRLQRKLADCPDTTGLDGKEARELLQTNPEFEPQMVVNNMLSHEWGHDGAPRWWKKQQTALIVKNLEDFIKDLDNKENPTPDDDKDRKEAKLRRKYLKRFGDEQLPNYVLRCDMAGMEQFQVFNRKERVAGEQNPEYWSPDIKRHSIPRSIGSERSEGGASE